jgi:hypothetical protein
MVHDGGWRRRSWRYLFESRWMKLRQDDITLPSGVEITYTVIEHPGFVVIVPVLANGRVVMEHIAIRSNAPCWSVLPVDSMARHPKRQRGANSKKRRATAPAAYAILGTT